MLDWLVSIQLEPGAFQGGMVDQHPVAPVVFNTGQILLGLARGAMEFGEPYQAPMRRAADWLVTVQDPDGCWRRFASPFAGGGDKVYDLHVAWGLLEASRVEPDPRWVRAALANVRWGLARQRANGWIDDCCLSDVAHPLTHTLGYALRGIIEAWRFSREVTCLRPRCAQRMDCAAHASRRLSAGPTRPLWRPSVRWSA